MPVIFKMSIRKGGMRWSQPRHWETSGKQSGMCLLSCLLPKMSKECMHMLVKCQMSGSKGSLKIPPEKPGQSWQKCVLSRQFSLTAAGKERYLTAEILQIPMRMWTGLSQKWKKSSPDILQGSHQGGAWTPSTNSSYTKNAECSRTPREAKVGLWGSKTKWYMFARLGTMTHFRGCDCIRVLHS